MADETRRMTCPEWALRIYDGLAVVTLIAAAIAFLPGSGAEGAAGPIRVERSWVDLAAAVLVPAAMIASLWVGRWRGTRDGDEYLRRLVCRAAAVGLAATIIFWSSWTILAESWVRPPLAEQVIGILFGSSALAYGWLRLRGAA